MNPPSFYPRGALKRWVSFCILASLLLISLPTQTSAYGTTGGEAANTAFGVPVHTTETVGPAGSSKNSFWTIVGRAVARTLLQQLTASIRDWLVAGIRDGFQFGQPYFIQNPRAFLLSQADIATGIYLREALGADYTALCSPFRVNILLSLFAYQFEPLPSCTLSGIISNVNAMYADFLVGGLGGFMSISTGVSNNAFASLLVTWDGMARVANSAAQNAKNFWDINSGMLFSKCIQWAYTYGGKQECAKYEATTPGGMVLDSISPSFAQDYEWLGLENDINALAAGTISAIIAYQLLPRLQDGLLGPPDPDDYPAVLLPNPVLETTQEDLHATASDILDHENSFLSDKNASLAAIDSSIAGLRSLETCASPAEDHTAEIAALNNKKPNIEADVSESEGYISQANGFDAQIDGITAASNLGDLGGQLADLKNDSDRHDLSSAASEKTTLEEGAAGIRANLIAKCPSVTP